jgi:hypothetical protein
LPPQDSSGELKQWLLLPRLSQTQRTDPFGPAEVLPPDELE